MLLLSLQLENFRQHKSTQIEFGSGLTGIIGKNGCGKSTVLEAIAWALYGAPAIRGTNDTIRCRAAEGNSTVEVKLVFSLGYHTYTVTRRIESSKSTASLEIDGTKSHTGFKDVTDAVTKVLGMDYQAFFTSFFTGQKELEFMRGMEGKQRIAAISKMLGYERLVKAREVANQDRLGLQREIEGLARGLANPEEIKARKNEASAVVKEAEKLMSAAAEVEEKAKKELDGIKPLRDLSEQKSKRFAELNRRFELDKAESARLTSRLNDVKTELNDLEKKKVELESLNPFLEEYKKAGEEYKKLVELQKYESRRSEIQGRLDSLSKDEKSLNDRIAAVADSVGNLESVEKSILEAETQLSDINLRLEKEREKVSSARHHAEAEIKQISIHREEIVAKKLKIEEAGRDGKCPTCERPLAEELPRVLAGFDEQIANLDSRTEKLRKNVAELENNPEAVTALLKLKETLERGLIDRRAEREKAYVGSVELANCKKDLESKQSEAKELNLELKALPVGFDQRRFTELRETGDKLRPYRERSIQLKAALERYTGLQEEQKQHEDKLSKVQEEIAATEKSLNELEFAQESHEKLIASFENVSNAYNAAVIDAERARGDLKAAQTALDAALNDEKAYKTKEAELKEAQKERVYIQTLAEAFDMLRTDLNSRAAPELSALASDLLSELTDGRYTVLEVDENYQAMIRDDGEIKQIISGGEEDVVNLALRLAVSQMITERAGQDLTLLVLDEVFGSLDDIRRDNVVELLQSLKNRFEQIIIITHVESIHDAVDNCIWIDYDESTKTSNARFQSLDDEMIESVI